MFYNLVFYGYLKDANFEDVEICRVNFRRAKGLNYSKGLHMAVLT